MRTKFILTIACLFYVLVSAAQQPTHWRGPSANGIYDEKGLLEKWPESGPEILWNFEGLGDGYSSPAIANRTIYVSGMPEEGKGYIFAFTLDGKLKWKKSYGDEFYTEYPGARSTPVIVGDLMYIQSATGNVVCMDANTGDIKWTKNIFKDFDGQQIHWAVTETLAVDGDKVFVTPGGKKNNVVALNRKTGDVIWSCEGNGEQSAYCSPLLVKLPARTLLVTHTGEHVIGIDVANGKLLWKHSQTNRHKVHANTPIYNNGEIFYFSGYGQGGGLIKLSADGSSITQQWFNPKMDNRIGGAVLVDGYIYGSGDNNRFWMCLDWKTGDIKYEAKGFANGTVISADGKLFGYTDNGRLFMAKASPTGFDVLSETKVDLGTGQHWAHPIINNGILYLRHGNNLIAYKVK